MPRPSRRSILGVLTLTTAVLGSTLLLSTPLLPAAEASDALPTPPPDRTLELRVEGGYHPDRLQAVAGERLRLVVTRLDWGGCTRHIVFPTLGLEVELPTGQPVSIDLPPLEAGELPFHCGMKMIRGAIHVAPAGG